MHEPATGPHDAMSDLELATDTAAVAVEAPVGAGDPLAVYLARLTSPESRRAMAGSLEFLAERLVDRGPATAEERRRRRQEQRLLASHIPWHRLRYAHTQALRSWLAEHCSPAAANRHLAALRDVLRKAWRLRLMNGEDLARAIDLAGIPSTSLPTGRYVEDGKVRRLVAACLDDDSPGGRRDAAVVTVGDRSCLCGPGGPWTQCGTGVRSRLVADASGAPALRD
jgi:hypothetical protein